MEPATGLDDFSQGLFGNKHKMAVVLAISDLDSSGAPEIYPRQVSKMLPEAADNQVANIMRQLEHAGLLVRMEDKEDGRRIYYRVRDVSLWRAMEALAAEVQDAAWLPQSQG